MEDVGTKMKLLAWLKISPVDVMAEAIFGPLRTSAGVLEVQVHKEMSAHLNSNLTVV